MKTKKIVLSSLFAALICVATMVIKIPTPIGGYANLGDCFVLLAAWFLPPAYGIAAAGIGSALADIFSGYAIYAPATLIIKACMAACGFFIYKLCRSKSGNMISRIISAFLAEIIMVAGYLLFEGAFMYGFSASALNILPNSMQGLVGIIVAVVLSKIFEKHNILK